MGYMLVLYNSTYVLCLCLCVSVCVCMSVCVSVQPEISGRGGCIAMLFAPSWRASTGELYKLLFEPIRHAVREKKPLEALRQLCTESCACTVTFPVTLDRMNLTPYNKVFGTFSKGVHWRTCPPHHRYHSCYCVLREWAIDTLQYEKLSTRNKTNQFVNGLQLVLYNK